MRTKRCRWNSRAVSMHHASHILRPVTMTVIVLFVFTISACSFGHRSFRSDTTFQDSIVDCPHNSDEKRKPSDKRNPNLAIEQDTCADKKNLLSFAVIEFDDRGRFWNRKQLQNVTKEIERISYAQKSHPNRGDAILLALYIHGWRHSASETSKDLQHFRKFAHDLANSSSVCNVRVGVGETCERQHKPHTLAVYFGWRGDATGATGVHPLTYPLRPLLRYLQIPTFWDRKRTARDIAGVAMTEAILTILTCIDTADRWRRDTVWNPPANTPRACGPLVNGDSEDGEYEVSEETASGKAGQTFFKSRKLLIGHSLGARALELAIAQAYLGDRAQSFQLYKKHYGEDGTQTRSLDEQNKRVNTLKMNIKDIAKRMDMTKSKIKKSNIGIKKLERAVLVKKESRSRAKKNQQDALLKLKEQLTYDDFGSVETDNSSCERYERTVVETCASKVPSTNYTIACVEGHVDCIYRTHICAIRDVLSRRKLEDMEESLTCGDAGRLAIMSCPIADDNTKSTVDRSFGETNDEDVAKRWVRIYCALRQQETLRVAAPNVGDEGGEVEMKIVDESVKAKDVADALLDQASEYFEQVRAWILQIKNRISGYEDDVFGQIKMAEEHLTVMIDRDEGGLMDARDTVYREAGNLSLIDSTIDRMKRSRSELRDQARKDEVIVKKLGGVLRETIKNFKIVERKRRSIEADIWYEKDEYLRPPADLVLLVNSASEAVVSLDFVNALEKTEDVPADLKVGVPPAVISMTSEGDWYTGALFPLGSWLGGLARLGARLEYDEDGDGDADETAGLAYGTLGHQEAQVTHVVKKASASSVNNRDNPKFTVGCDKYIMEPQTSVPTGYWVVTLPRDVIAGHGDIFGSEGQRGDCPRKPLLGIVEGLIDNVRLFEPLCVLNEKKKCGPRKTE